MKVSLGPLQALVDTALLDITENQILKRIWERDYTVWKSDPHEIHNRLGWLSIASDMEENLPRLRSFLNDVKSDDFTHVLLLGMGGSSLAPEVFQKTFTGTGGPYKFSVLDSTDPDAIIDCSRQLDVSKTLFIVSTKSGGTVETISLFKYFFNQVSLKMGVRSAGNNFVAITDPGSSLTYLAKQYRFRDVFLNNPDIGGRYSALSYFGLLPAALIGVDLETLLERANRTANNCAFRHSHAGIENPCIYLGAIMGTLAKTGRDKLTLITSDAIAGFSDWVEQLIAESTGKEGKGILPVSAEPVMLPESYSNDRLFVYLELEGKNTQSPAVQSLEDAGQPVVRLSLDDLYDLGGQFFLWQMATAVAGYLLQINPFDQPDVEASKILARRMVEEFQKKGYLPQYSPKIVDKNISVFWETRGKTSQDALLFFISQAPSGGYLALQAFLNPSPPAVTALQKLRIRLHDITGLAVTTGLGPRFLHSTGQLHKGDGGQGLFIQLTGENLQDIPIPDEAGSNNSSLTFGILKNAQALGDYQALIEAGRKVIRFHLAGDPIDGLNQLSSIL